MNIRVGNVAVAIVALVALLAFHLVTPPSGGFWLQAFYDCTHVPVFGAVAVGALLATPNSWATPRRFLVSLLVVAVLGIVSELAQVPGARDASLTDLRSDLLGGAGALCLALAVCRRFALHRRARGALLVAGLAIIAVALAPLAWASATHIARSSWLPSLAQFDSRFMTMLYRAQSSTVSAVPDPESGAAAAEVVLGDGRWPGIAFEALWPDWRAYDALEIEFENPSAEPLPLTIRIDDRSHRSNQTHEDRFNRPVQLAPGRQTVRIGMQVLREAPAGRSMNLAEIDRLIVFAPAGLAGRRFILHDLRLVARQRSATTGEGAENP